MNKPKYIKLKHIETIETPHSGWLTSICLLKDKRLVSSDYEGEIIVYNHSHQPQIQIQNAHDGAIYSLCVLRNGDLASSSKDKTIKIWNENEYKLIHTLKGHTDWVYKVIELEDGRICSCSSDKRIIVWDNNTYQSIAIITAHTDYVQSILEMNDFIVSVSNDLKKWNKLTYECIQITQNIHCNTPNAVEKINNHTVLLGDYRYLFLVDIESSEVEKGYYYSLEFVQCLRVIRNDFVLIGNNKGEIIYRDVPSLCDHKILENINGDINCLIATEDNKLIISLKEGIIKIYEYN